MVKAVNWGNDFLIIIVYFLNVETVIIAILIIGIIYLLYDNVIY